jgi:hypothetical protein
MRIQITFKNSYCNIWTHCNSHVFHTYCREYVVNFISLNGLFQVHGRKQEREKLVFVILHDD